MDADKFCELLTGDMVDVYVGPEGHHYRLSLKLLSRHSSYFDRAFNGDFKEGATKRLDLLDDDIHAFNLLVKWIYTGQVNTPKRHDTAKSAKAFTEDDATGTTSVPIQSSHIRTPFDLFSSCNVPVATKLSGSDDGAEQELCPVNTGSHLKLYVLADKLGMPMLKNQTIDAIIRAGYYTEGPDNGIWGQGLRTSSYIRFHPETIIWIYENTLPGSPLRKLASTSAAYCILLRRANVSHYEECLGGEFVIDLVNAMQENADNSTLSQKPILEGHGIYHDRRDEVCTANAAGEMSGVDRLHQLSPAAKFVLEEIEDNSALGFHVTVQKLVSRSSYDVVEVKKAVDELLKAGLIPNSVNDDTGEISGFVPVF